MNLQDITEQLEQKYPPSKELTEVIDLIDILESSITGLDLIHQKHTYIFKDTYSNTDLIKGWRVEYTRKGTRYNRYFGIKAYTTTTAALLAAIKYRDLTMKNVEKGLVHWE